MAQTRPKLCDTTGFIELFVRPMSDNAFRHTYVMSNYELGCDFYTRFATDLPDDIYQHMHADLLDPDKWWTLRAEPTATARTLRVRRGDWRYVVPRLQNQAVPLLARL